MKIVRTYIKDDLLHIQLDKATPLTKLYIDTIDNKCKIYSSLDEDHTKVIENPSSIDNINYTIDISTLNQNALIVTIVTPSKYTAFALNEEAIYYSKIGMLTIFCSTCLDKALKWKILIAELRSNLLKCAIENDLIMEAIEHYEDLDRVLNINSCYKPCNGCENGMCGL